MNIERVDKYDPVPAYYQLKKIIRENIESEELKPGDRILSENELGKLYNISRMTVRQAIQELCEEGLLYKERGKGTFVRRPKLRRDLSELTSLTESLNQDGYKTKTQILEMKVVPASKRVARELEITLTDKVIEISRLRFIDNEPFCLETSFIPFEICPKLVEDDLFGNSLYSVLEKKYGLRIDRAITTIEVILTNKYQSRVLKTRKNAPILLTNQVTYLHDGRPIQLVEAVSRSDKYKYQLTRIRRR